MTRHNITIVLPVYLFMLDAAKSPSCPKIEPIAPIKQNAGISLRSNFPESQQYKPHNIAAESIPPILPSIDL